MPPAGGRRRGWRQLIAGTPYHSTSAGQPRPPSPAASITKLPITLAITTHGADDALKTSAWPSRSRNAPGDAHVQGVVRRQRPVPQGCRRHRRGPALVAVNAVESVLLGGPDDHGVVCRSPPAVSREPPPTLTQAVPAVPAADARSLAATGATYQETAARWVDIRKTGCHAIDTTKPTPITRGSHALWYCGSLGD